MQATHLWDQFNIHRRKISLLLLFFGIASVASGQIRKQFNPEYDNRFLSYGFLIGIHTTTYQSEYSERFTTPALDSLYSINARWSPGFSLGFIVNLKLADFLDFRLLPKVAFYEHVLEYRRLDEPTITELVETTVVEFPLLFKYKSERRGNTRMYLVGGIKPGIEASGKNDIDEVSEENISIKSFNTSLELGFGIDIYYPLFKFSPEIRFSKGMTNMLGNEENLYSEGLRRLNTNTITLYFLFQ